MNDSTKPTWNSIKNKIGTFGNSIGTKPETIKQTQEAVKHDIITAKNQSKTAVDILHNIDSNIGKAKSLSELIGPSIGATAPPPPTTTKIVTPEKPKEKLNKKQKQHIGEITKILKSQPELKKDIKKTITEELAKGNMNDEAFNEYNDEINKLEVSEAIREEANDKKQRKKNKQSDKPINPISIEQTPNMKTINKPKKKTKVVD